MNMENFEPFDLKITKLTGNTWDRTNGQNLLVQLMQKQGNPRYSVENRIIIAFDKSSSSSMAFLQKNKAVIVDALVKIAISPYQYTYWLEDYNCWGGIFIIRQGDYDSDVEYYEHPIGLGMREQGKADFETQVVREVAIKTNYQIRPNRNYKEIGKDGELKIDVSRLLRINRIKDKQLGLWG